MNRSSRGTTSSQDSRLWTFVWGRGAWIVLAITVALVAAPSSAEAFVRSVEYVEIVLGPAQTTNSANLNKGQTVADCVPFASTMATSGANEFRRVFTDISLAAGAPPTVTATRATAGGTLTVGVYVVEFNSTYVRVQQGTFLINNTFATDTLGITAVDTAQAAVVAYHSVADPTPSYEDTLVTTVFPAANQLQFRRGGTTDTIAGSWYVFEALNVGGSYVFDVQTKSFGFTGASGTSTALSPTVASDSTLVVGSYRTSSATGNPEFGAFRLSLSGCAAGICSTVTANAYSGTTIAVVAYVITFSGGVRVQRGALSYGAATTQVDASLTPAVDLPRSMVWNAFATGPGMMRANANLPSLAPVAHQRLTLVDATTARGNRATSGNVAEGTWEVVEWARNCCSLATTEDVPAGTVTVTAPGSFEMVYSTAAGGGMMELYDLAEDPLGTVDLAGGDSPPGGHSRSLHTSGLQVGAGVFWNAGNNDTGSQLELLEATSTRVRVRQDSFYQNAPGGPILGGVKAIGDHSIYPSGRVGLRWERRVTDPAGVLYVSEYKEIFLHLVAAPLDTWQGYHDAGALPGVGSGQSHFILGQIENMTVSPGARTDILEILHRDWTAGNGHFNTANNTRGGPSGSRYNIFWQEFDGETNGLTLPDGRTDVWNSLTYIKPTTLANHLDADVTERSADYRGPAIPGITAGSTWRDADENTAADDFNEAEAAYLFTLHPTNGLRFDLDGAGTTRFAPFFKIRQWRSIFAPESITFDPDSGGAAPAVTLTRDADYRADIKPVSRAHFAQTLRWYSTLQSAAAVTGPDVGGAGQVVGAPVFGAARYGDGASIGANTQYVAFPTSDYDPALGAVEFWFQPAFNSADGVHHDLCGFSDGIGDVFVLEKTVGNNLNFIFLASGTISQLRVAAADYGWRPGDWVHIRMEWDDTLPLATQQRLFLNGVEPVHTDPINDYNSASLTVQPVFRFGNIDGDLTFAPGVFDEIHLYGGSSTTPAPLAHGGLTIDASEYLVDGTRDFTLALSPVDGATTRRGEYAYFGSDSKFRGLNVALATAGASAGALDLQWRFWDGTSWAALAVTDETAGFTRDGTVYWGSDPAGWSAYSVNGGPDLYYVRAHLANTSAAYTTPPVEGAIKTDVLLFQYCGDVATDDEEFIFAAPVPTAVELLSFAAAPGDSAVDLAWRTGSELRNLGFHLHRSLSETGPWARITPSLIPGLGSSPEGASYSFLDTGLVNGVRYFYRVEDIDSESGSTFHGPVSAVPHPGGVPPGQETEPEDTGESDPDESNESSDSGSEEGSTSEDASTADSKSKTYGRPEAASFRVVSRTKRAMVVELRTPGFVATETPSGVQVSVPGFDQRRNPRAPDLPVKRVVLDAVVGRHARIVWVKERKTRSFPGLTPAAVGAPEIVSSPDGTVRPRRRGAALRADGLLPRFAARIPGDAFIGENKKLALEMSPLRYDAATDELRLARRLRVKIAFDRKAASSESGYGSRGRRRPRSLRRGTSPVLAHLHTQTRGLYAVSFEALFPQGHEALPLGSLRLSRQGESVPIHVEPKAKDFGPGSVLYLHASSEAASMDYSSEVAYALEQATGGVQMPLASAKLRKLQILESAPLAQHRSETNRFYQAGLLDAPDIWLWDFVVGGTSKSFPVSIEGLDPTSPLPAHLQVVFQGASEAETEGEHHLSVSLNGTPLGETSFDGKLAHVFSTSVPASVLLEGENSLTITNLGDTGAYSFVFLDRVDLVYPQVPALRSGRFSGVFSETGRALVSGEAQVGLDVTDPDAPVWLQGLRHKAGTVRFKAEAGHRYVLASPEGLLAPRVSTPLRSTLRSTRNQADYVVIAPEAFLEAAQPLLERRQDQGLTTKAVSFEQIASEFGHGRPSAQAIRDVLAYAYHSWRQPSLRYVLLLGDSSYDPRNFTGFDQGAPLPAMWAKTSYLWTSSDPTLAAVNGEDLLPDVAIGRLPAKTLEEAQALVQKVLAWEDSAQDLSGTAVLVADNPDLAGDFEADVLDIRSSFLGGRETKTLFLRQLGGATRPEILSSFDEGASLMSYVGHGGAAVWASENVLNSWDTGGLRDQSSQPLMLTFNCLNGYFVAPNYDSLSEAFVKVEGRGTIGAFSPSGLSLDAPAHKFHRALMAEITGGTHERLGDAVLAAQAAYAETGVMPELLAIYHLLADPGMTIRP